MDLLSSYLLLVHLTLQMFASLHAWPPPPHGKMEYQETKNHLDSGEGIGCLDSAKSISVRQLQQ